MNQRDEARIRVLRSQLRARGQIEEAVGLAKELPVLGVDEGVAAGNVSLLEPAPMEKPARHKPTAKKKAATKKKVVAKKKGK